MARLRRFLVKDRIEAGCDEAGRGCLAGPVFAAAVILPRDFRHPLLNDSKLLKEPERLKVRAYIEKHALAWAVGQMDNHEIDRINILNASFGAMHRAIEQLQLLPEHLLIDGNRFHAFPGIPHTCIVGGDGKFAAIAAASVLAKTYRDEMMCILHQDFPEYGWDENKGYPTTAHRAGIRRAGLSPYHRQSFRQLPLEEQLALFADDRKNGAASI